VNKLFITFSYHDHTDYQLVIRLGLRGPSTLRAPYRLLINIFLTLFLSGKLEPADLDGMRVLQGVQLQGDDENVAAELLPHLELGMDPIVIVFFTVVDPKRFVSDPTPDPTFKEISAPTPDPESDLK
jgi:hypothetical protein